MEGTMPIGRRYREANYHILDYGREPDFDFHRTPDAAGYWFLAAVLLAFIAAGIIVHRTGALTPAQTATVATSHAAAQDNPIAPAALLQTR
jgi:hypothetical protein